MTNLDERRRLLRIARDALAAHLGERPGAAPVEPHDPSWLAGVFVTLRTGRELRGCIGHIEADEPLARLVARCAVAAASSDPRFPPVTSPELTRLAIEVSILGPFEAIAGPAEIEIGRHGLLVECRRQRGLLLPQVAVEWGWDARQFVAETYRKAGLARDAAPDASLWRFEAEVFGEE
jgi:AmmeMemoRadiSam system protein A